MIKIGLVIAIFWLIFSSLIFIEFVDLIGQIGPKEKIVVIIIILIGGPIFATYQLLETILNLFLPEGWNDDEGRPPGL